jgi:hypothetical protein
MYACAHVRVFVCVCVCAYVCVYVHARGQTLTLFFILSIPYVHVDSLNATRRVTRERQRTSDNVKPSNHRLNISNHISHFAPPLIGQSLDWT